MGFAELISETAAEPRVQQDAETIVREAQRMRSTVERLVCNTAATSSSGRSSAANSRTRIPSVQRRLRSNGA